MFDLHRERIPTSSEFGNLEISPEGSNHSTLFDLMLDIGEREQGLVATFTYSTDLFEPDYIAMLVEGHQQLLHNVVQQLRASLEQLSGLLSQAPQVSRRSAAH